MKKGIINKYKRYTNLNIFDRFLNYLDYLANKHGFKFCACFMIYLIIILLIDILS